MKPTGALYITITLCASLFLFSCTSSVRFASDVRHNTVKKTSHSQKKDRKTVKPSDIEETNCIVKNAKLWLGTPYKYGGESKSGADCSGFVQSVFSSCGIDLPRTAAQQWDFVQRIARSSLIAGDLVFFKSGAHINHVGIFVGDNLLIHASTSQGVIIQDLDNLYLSRRIAGFGRVKQ
jgi:cell wall-associated NlpC family hydrolase